jgi:2-polyprenyl-6-methoxyphenol hydroxylase-like FAD-dependent oxidoreductase
MWRDAVVIGGGPAGATVALLLARAGWSVDVIEQAAFPRRKVCGEFLSATNLPLLREIGLADDFLSLAGPAVRRVGVFAGAHAVTAEMPRLDPEGDAWGRALGREHLDSLLLDRAAASGAAVWQPYTAVDIGGAPGHFTCTIAPAR